MPPILGGLKLLSFLPPRTYISICSLVNFVNSSGRMPDLLQASRVLGDVNLTCLAS